MLKQRFVANAFPNAPRRLIMEDAETHRRIRREYRNFFGRYDFTQICEETGIGRKIRNGVLINPYDAKRVELSRIDGAWQIGHIALQMEVMYDIARVRPAIMDFLKIIRQLQSLEHNVTVQHLGKSCERVFVKLAKKAGAETRVSRIQLDPSQNAMTWARDELARIGEKTVNLEGGVVVQFGPNEYIVSESPGTQKEIAKLPGEARIVPVQNGIMHNKIASELVGTNVYYRSPHIDFSVGGIPELRIVAVDSLWAKESDRSMAQIRRNKPTSIVFVPEEESRHNPACFLPLGGKQVLVDRNAPKFIEALKEAGAEPIPTIVPMENILFFRGGLHCLFREH